MKDNIKLQLEGYNNFTSRGINNIIKDLSKIEGFEIESANNSNITSSSNISDLYQYCF